MTVADTRDRALGALSGLALGDALGMPTQSMSREAIAQRYGVFNDKLGFAVRGTFLVDTSGIVRFAEVNGPGEPRDQEAWQKAIAAL